MGENYTADEYREALIAIHDMDGDKRKEVFGENRWFDDYLFNFSASEIAGKYRAYKNAPKVGEYWKRKTDGEMAVIRRVEENLVYLYLCDSGHSNCFSRKCFTNSYIKTERKSQYLELLLKEMKEMSK